MNQLEAIRRMIDAHNRAVRSAYVVTREPDMENRDTADVDAYAESVGLPPLAIEHTKIPTLQDQVRDSAWFL